MNLAVHDFSSVEQQLTHHFRAQGLGAPGASETRSWRHSIPTLARDLCDAGLEKTEVVLEHRLPLSSKRTDVILAGVHPRTGAPSYVVVELKQWSAAHRWEGSDTLVDVDGAAYRPVLHPSVQVAGYAEYLRDFVRMFAQTPESLSAVAYLHNADDLGVADLWDNPALGEAPMFTGQERGKLHAHLRTRLEPGASGAEAADLFLSSAVAPSRQLLTVAAKEVQDREQFVLVDEQRVAFELVLRSVERARRQDAKSVVVVTGGPGSGKSVIALSLLGELARQGRTVIHATGSRSFTQTMRHVAGRRSTRTKALFKYFNSFMDAEPNGLDVVILDEAHRIRATSVNRYTSKAVRDRARPQIEELLSVARVPVFLLDEHQVVRPGEMGTLADIERHAEDRGLDVLHVDLKAQYRAGGSEAYIDWVQRLLGLTQGGPVPWVADSAFSVDVVSSVGEMEGRLRAYRDSEFNARMTAGYCWPWSDPRPDGSLVPDVVVGGWSMPWNLKGERRVGDAPPASLWASDPAGFDQVGCVYTAQGFEYSWNGVILGPDLVWRASADEGTGGWVSQRDRNKDPDFRSRAKVSDAEFDRLVRHVYKVLLTRGMVGTLLYSTDPETNAMLRSLVP
ncbi:DUF2075 domain-containing protein [Sanguibacter suaedae]|uniref:DUF2075 domain-containing protein n=1 Tax=Sanguibacter suaedae TaxID=2795737 RepID=A0A934MAL4_9MICO|nr:DUF2075 domain-containing protein [Sanguibacter suaedae]MBI9115735.1 DUF2075 domain-containing protein [Sanguibacter suaedae]